MINKIISFSIKNKLLIGLLLLVWIAFGIYSMNKVPVDAVPDITNNQVQVITTSPNLGTEDIEQFVTYPVELAMANLPGVTEIRSISRFGLSVVTIVFEDDKGTFLPRQLIAEKLNEINIPKQFGKPFMGPIATGLGEVYQYSLKVAEGYNYSLTELRTHQDWIVKRQMAMVQGVIEVNSFGGNIKQYEVAIDPNHLKSMGITISDVFSALEQNNGNTGGAYIVKNHQANFIRGEGLIHSLGDIEQIVVKTVNKTPILVRDIARVSFGKAIRYGAFTKDGKGEAVGGMVLMLKGANSNEVIDLIKKRVVEIEKSLPKGISIEPFLDRSDLIDRTTSTVSTNLLEGGLIVVLVLVLFLGNFRGGLIVASTIPLSLLFAYIMMNLFGVWSNLMSLGAIDFGIIVDGAVIIVESVAFYTMQFVRQKEQPLTNDELDNITYNSSSKMMNSAFFGQLIILIVFLPILTLTGVEGKMFKPMAMTFSFAVMGAMILCLTYVPMVSALFMNKKAKKKLTFGDRFIVWLENNYVKLLSWVLTKTKLVLGLSVAFMAVAIFLFSRMGGEFMPNLDEGDLALHALLKPGSSLDEAIQSTNYIEEILLAKFPEVKEVVARIGVSEIPIDPMPMDVADMFVLLKPKKEWVSASSKEELVKKFKKELAVLPGINFEFTQPVQMRFNELLTGVRQDVAIKLYGESLAILTEKSQQIASIVQTVEGVGDLKVEATQGLPQMSVRFQRDRMAQYGLSIEELNSIIKMAFAGETAGVVFEGEKRFDLVIRLKETHRKGITDLENIFIPLADGSHIPLREVAKIDFQPGLMQVSRENTNRRIYVGVNVRGRDIQSFVEEVQTKIDAELDLPTGYYIKYGGTFENLQRAKDRLLIVVPLVLFLIFVLLYLALKSFWQTMIIYIAIPLSAVGGVFSLWVMGMPFSISAGVGFIVLFGVAVLNGLVLIASFNDLKTTQGENMTLKERILKGAKERIRPIFLTATTDVLGFLPMAISVSAGAEVQRPLATVVIGGLLTSSLLTLVVLPVLYAMIENKTMNKIKLSPHLLALLVVFCVFTAPIKAQTTLLPIEKAVEIALSKNGSMQLADLEIERQKTLKSSAISIKKTNFDFNYGQINSINNDFGFEINQKFQFPSLYKKQVQLAKGQIVTSELQKAITGNELKKEVKAVWLHLAYLHQRQQLLIFQDSIYQQFAHATKIRYETEETSYLEFVNAEAQVMQIEMEKEQNLADISIYQTQLKTLLNVDYLVDATHEKLQKRVFVLDTNAISSNPLLSYYMHQSTLAEQKKAVLKASNLPDFRVGYFNQSMVGWQDVDNTPTYFEGKKRFQGVQFGVAIPIWFKGNSAKVKASGLDKMKAETQANYYKTQLLGKYKHLIQTHHKLKLGIAYYETKGISQANLILGNAQKSFAYEAINYIEYVQSIDVALAIKFNYLKTLNQYNQSVVEIDYLLGK